MTQQQATPPPDGQSSRIDYSSYRRYRQTTDALLRDMFSPSRFRESFAQWLAGRAARPPTMPRTFDLIVTGLLVIAGLVSGGLLTFSILRGKSLGCVFPVILFIAMTVGSFVMIRGYVYALIRLKQPYFRNLCIGTFLVMVIPFALWTVFSPSTGGSLVALTLVCFVFSIPLALVFEELPIKLTLKRLLLISVLTAIIGGVLWGVILLWLSGGAGIQPQQIFRETNSYDAILSAYFTFWMLFPIVWALVCAVARAPRWVKTRLKVASGALAGAANGVHGIFLLLNEQLRINRAYSYTLVALLVYALLVLVCSFLHNPNLFAAYVLGFGTVIGMVLARVTFNYLTIPEELQYVRVEMPTFYSRPIVRALIVLGLLLGAWWVLYGFLFRNINLAFSHSFESTIAGKVEPDIGDYMFYSFALLTNAGYGDIHATDWLAKLYTMMATVTGLALLVIFIQAALAQLGSTKRDHDLAEGENPDAHG